MFKNFFRIAKTVKYPILSISLLSTSNVKWDLSGYKHEPKTIMSIYKNNGMLSCLEDYPDVVSINKVYTAQDHKENIEKSYFVMIANKILIDTVI